MPSISASTPDVECDGRFFDTLDVILILAAACLALAFLVALPDEKRDFFR
jgi:hypothetical protein